MPNGYVESCWGQVHYCQAGSGGPDVILLHQTPLSARQFGRVLPLLGEACRATAFDTPGYGNSARPPGPPSIGAYAEALREAALAVCPGRFALCGVATGALIAAEMARLEPERVTHLVLSGMPHMPAEDLKAMGRASLNIAPMQLDGAHLTDTWKNRQRVWGEDLDPALLNSAVADIALSYDHFHWGMLANSSWDVAATVASVKHPSLFLSGDRDRLASFNERAACEVARARHIVIEGARDPLYTTAPERFARHIVNFIRS